MTQMGFVRGEVEAVRRWDAAELMFVTALEWVLCNKYQFSI